MAKPAAVAFKDAVLSHIWQSAQVTKGIKALLQLPEAFYVHPRNFLVLRKSAEVAFDSGVLLLLPSASGTINTRYFEPNTPCLPTGVTVDAVKAMAERTLYLPRAAESCVPFMRLLGWTTICHLRQHWEDGVEWTPPPAECSLDASITAGTAGILQRRVDEMRKFRWAFRSLDEKLQTVTAVAAGSRDAAAAAASGGATAPAGRVAGAAGLAAGGRYSVAAATAELIAHVERINASAGGAGAGGSPGAVAAAPIAGLGLTLPAESAVADASRVGSPRGRMPSPLSKSVTDGK